MVKECVICKRPADEHLVKGVKIMLCAAHAAIDDDTLHARYKQVRRKKK
jgi:hypothetical protein